MKDDKFLTTIDEEGALTAESFYERFVIPGRPVLIKGAVRHWKALDKWNPVFFKTAAGSLELPVKTDDVSKGKTTEMMLGAYVSALLEYESMLVRGEVESGTFPYLHDVPIFHLMPGLAKDVEPFPLEYFPKWYHNHILRYAQFFMSATGSITPLHFDTLYTHNLFFQVYGTKQFILIPAGQKKFCYMQGWRWAQVKASMPDYVRYPRFQQANPVRLTIEPGDMLFMPSGTLHEVKTLCPSISFNIDWHTPKTALKGLMSGLKGAPLENVYYNALICASLCLKVSPERIFPFYRPYLSYIS
jgi:ribosomal protein L16 Arg81 hydroxylase